MAQMVLVANRNAEESRGIVDALNSQFEAKAVLNTGDMAGSVDKASALVIDSNFSEAQGVDVLMDVLARVHVPVIMITPVDDQSCAVEAIRCGAACFLVKSGNYTELILPAVREAIQRSNTTGNLKREIVELRKRILELETEARAAAAAANAAAIAARKHKRSVTDQLIARMRSGELTLPSYPKIALKLRELLETDAGMADIAQLLSHDAAVSARLLQVANSAQYANARKVDSVEKAVSRLGLVGACNVAEMIANQSLYIAKNAAYLPFFNELWVHSVACAHACTILGRHVERAASPKLFSLGLLHDVGKLAILQAVSQSDAEGRLISGDEEATAFRAFMRAHHVQFGVILMQRWEFDREFLAVGQHHDDLGSARRLSRSLLIVHLANLLARARGHGEPLEAEDALDKAPSRIHLFPGEADFDAIGEELDAAVAKTLSLLA